VGRSGSRSWDDNEPRTTNLPAATSERPGALAGTMHH